MKDLTGNFYTTEYDENIINYLVDNFNAHYGDLVDCDLLEVKDNWIYTPPSLCLLAKGSIELSNKQFREHLGMPVPDEEDLFEADREMGILRAENQMFKDNIKILKEHVNMLQERLDVAQNNCKLRETLQQNAEQHNYITAKKFNDTLAENHKLKEHIKQLENK